MIKRMKKAYRNFRGAYNEQIFRLLRFKRNLRMPMR
jgi:hypothetical protein